MKLASLLSGGKDSLYATYLVMKEGHEVKYLITMVPDRQDSYMFHKPCIEFTKLQAESLGIKQIMCATKGEKEKELEDLVKVLSGIAEEIDGVVSGALASNYQKSRIDRICEELGLESIAPLWQADQLERLKEEVKEGFEIIITAVAAEGFDESWLGRVLGEDAISDLENMHKRFGIHIGGEGGEYETFVLNCPLFRNKINFVETKKIWDKKTSSGYLKVKNAELVDKD